jgi:hypothetical protein
MKKIKEIAQNERNKTSKQFPFPFTKLQPVSQSEEDHDCSECDNVECKCIQIMKNLSYAADLAEQNGHNELYNILLTILTTLQNLENHEDNLLKILETCQEVYKSVSPKEMGCTIN